MSGPGTFLLLAAGAQLATALVWGAMAAQHWTVLRTRRPGSAIFRLLFLLTGFVAVHYLLFAVTILVPALLQREPLVRGIVSALTEGGVLVPVALARHLVRVWSIRADPPGRRWLGWNYGACAVATAFVVLANLGFVPGAAPGSTRLLALFTLYPLVMVALAARDVRRLAARGAWRPRRLGESRTSDGVVLAVGLGCLLGGHLLPLAYGTTPDVVMMTGGGPPAAARRAFVLHAVGGLAVAFPFAVRDLVGVCRGSITGTAMIAAVAAVYLGGPALTARIADPDLRTLADVGAVLGLVALLALGRGSFHRLIDRLILRRRRVRWAELQASLHTLTPEAGTVECCRRALADLVRSFQLPGGAILLHDGEAVVEGAFAVAPLVRAWPRGAALDALPAISFGFGGLRELPLPLKEALVEADVAWAAPITSPRRRWGYLFIPSGPHAVRVSMEDVADGEALANQLGLVLDAADLLARAVGVERSLAHAEKLAAIGELSARIAHEIRNPVTAARSLAQQLAGAPASPADAEAAGLIVTELERVERQVAALLRFARREEFSFEPVDVGELARATVGTLRARLEAAGVGVVLEAADGVIARADREKLRQVVLNLVENAVDALAEMPGDRHISLTVGTRNGSAALRVADSGPGVPADALARLFEPFFSLKAHGTGLGLAIVKRTVEAHGGRLAATRAAEGGLAFDVELPLGGT